MLRSRITMPSIARRGENGKVDMSVGADGMGGGMAGMAGMVGMVGGGTGVNGLNGAGAGGEGVGIGGAGGGADADGGGSYAELHSQSPVSGTNGRGYQRGVVYYLDDNNR